MSARITTELVEDIALDLHGHTNLAARLSTKAALEAILPILVRHGWTPPQEDQ